MSSHSLTKITGLLTVCLAMGATASAQYGGGGGGTGGMGGGTGTGSHSSSYSYGNGKAIGIGVGAAAAAGVGIALLVHHHHKVAAESASLVGCTQSLFDGMSVKNEVDNQTYKILSNGATLPAGERLELKGAVADDHSGTRTFRVRSVVNNYGACGSDAAAGKETAKVTKPEAAVVASK